GDTLAAFLAIGFGATTFSGTRGGMFVQAAENWTDAAQGTRLFFNTTATGTNTPSTKMTVDPSGNIGIGTFAPQAPLEVVRTGTNAAVVSTLYANGTDSGAFFVAQTARGTAAAPAVIQVGDFLGAFLLNGYGGSPNFNEAAAVAAIAAENFTTTASGSALVFGTTPIGGNDGLLNMALLPNGNLSIGTPPDANGIPTAADKLQVFGDIRVGNGGTNGCVRNFAGTQLTGVCASDRRYKKGITPFGPTLDRVASLQPVHFYWRADEFPDQHFGDSQAYGLIAQDVERVLPELVVTHDDGYKAVDYSKLPLLTIQAVKELKAENDALKTANDDLARRVAELERLVKEIRLPTGGAR
ncbi:MAG TPA: tail fiber domain-containing protein, partial [Vicinamibacterales bacterium]